MGEARTDRQGPLSSGAGGDGCGRGAIHDDGDRAQGFGGAGEVGSSRPDHGALYGRENHGHEGRCVVHGEVVRHRGAGIARGVPSGGRHRVGARGEGGGSGQGPGAGGGGDGGVVGSAIEEDRHGAADFGGAGEGNARDAHLRVVDRRQNHGHEGRCVVHGEVVRHRGAGIARGVPSGGRHRVGARGEGGGSGQGPGAGGGGDGGVVGSAIEEDRHGAADFGGAGEGNARDAHLRVVDGRQNHGRERGHLVHGEGALRDRARTVISV